MEPSDPESPAVFDSRTIGPLEIFVVFSKLALSGFGGVLPFAYRALVEKRQWLTAKEFAGLLAMAQVMPGPTICNLSVMIGQRYAGFAGACAALGGMVAGPSLIVLALGNAWQHYGEIPAVRRALTGMSAVAIGLLLSTAVKMGMALFKPASRANVKDGVKASLASGPFLIRVAQGSLCVAAFAGVGLLRWPLIAIVAVLAPFAVGLAWRTQR